LLVLILLLIILAVTLLGKFKLAKLAMLAISFASYIIVGSVVLTVPEIILDILVDALEDIFGIFAALIDLSGLIYAELAAGYWVTLFALAGMLLMEIAMFLKGRFAK